MTQVELNTLDRFARLNGIQITSQDRDCSRVEMFVEERHLNGADVCQGGALFTLADLAMAAVANGGDESLALSVNTEIHFLRPAVQGDKLIAECHMIKNGKLPLLRTTITNTEGKLIATAEGQFYRK